MASKFTDVYKKARSVVTTQKFAEPDWQKFLSEAGVQSLLGAEGLDAAHARTPDKIREKIKKDSKGKLVSLVAGGGPGDVIYAAAQNQTSPGKWQERAATLKMLRHLYRASKTGAQDVWVYSPPKRFKAWVFDEIQGDAKAVKSKLGQEAEIFSDKEKTWMCDALKTALKICEDTKLRLSKKDAETRKVVRRWFIDEGSGDDELDDAFSKLSDGFKKIAVTCGSTTLVFTDYADWRAERNKYFGGAIRGGEGGGFPVIYLEGAFTKLTGNSGKQWLCVQTIIHEFSHHDVKTDDHRYDHHGLKPDKAAFPYAKAIENADSWGYFALDLAGYLSRSDRSRTLK